MKWFARFVLVLSVLAVVVPRFCTADGIRKVSDASCASSGNCQMGGSTMEPVLKESEIIQSALEEHETIGSASWTSTKLLGLLIGAFVIVKFMLKGKRKAQPKSEETTSKKERRSRPWHVTLWHQALRLFFAILPPSWRFAMYRRMVTCETKADPRLVLKVAETRDELENCFRILHDSYVASGFMKPHPSGLRVTPYHALPTTTTICAKWEGVVVGTVSLVREGSFGIPLEKAYDLSSLRARGGNVTEVSALAIDKNFRQDGGTILFALMRYLYKYSVRNFDTRHLVIAVNPSRIELYEGLLLFSRLPSAEVDHYDFANGAPAVGATLDLWDAPKRFYDCYHGKKESQDLHRYLVVDEPPTNHYPNNVLYTTNHPVMTPALLDYFFNQRTQGFSELSETQKRVLRDIYYGKQFQIVLPTTAAQPQIRSPRHGRYVIRLPAKLTWGAEHTKVKVEVVELAKMGGRFKLFGPDLSGVVGQLSVQFGPHAKLTTQVHLKRDEEDGHYSFSVDVADGRWSKCATLLRKSYTHADLLNGLATPL